MQPSLKMNVETSPPKYFCLCTKKPSFHFLLFQFRISGLLGCVPAAIGKKGSTLDRLSVSCRVYTCAWTWIIPSIHLYIHFFPTYPILGLEPIPAVVQREAWYPLDRSPICCRARPWMNHPYHHESSVFVFILTDSSALKWMFQLAGCFIFVWWWMFLRLLIALSH